MKKFIIYNLTNRASFKQFQNSRPLFAFDATDAYLFDSREEANKAVQVVSSLMLRKTPENAFWCDGSVLTILEVYV